MEWRVVEPGAGQEGLEQSGPVLHPPPPGSDQPGQLARGALDEAHVSAQTAGTRSDDCSLTDSEHTNRTICPRQHAADCAHDRTQNRQGDCVFLFALVEQRHLLSATTVATNGFAARNR
jgi:hypothetical protein